MSAVSSTFLSTLRHALSSATTAIMITTSNSSCRGAGRLINFSVFYLHTMASEKLSFARVARCEVLLLFESDY